LEIGGEGTYVFAAKRRQLMKPIGTSVGSYTYRGVLPQLAQVSSIAKRLVENEKSKVVDVVLVTQQPGGVPLKRCVRHGLQKIQRLDEKEERKGERMQASTERPSCGLVATFVLI
jgi:hypothetical protein